MPLLTQVRNFFAIFGFFAFKMESKAVDFIHSFAELKRLQFNTTVLVYLSSKFFQKVVYKVYNVFLKTQNM